MIDVNAPFSEAFRAVGLSWVGRIVSLGALAGITTSLLVSLMGQARIHVVLGREKLLPPWIVSYHAGTIPKVIQRNLSLLCGSVNSYFVCPKLKAKGTATKENRSISDANITLMSSWRESMVIEQ